MSLLPALPHFLLIWFFADIVLLAVFDIACVAGRDEKWRKAEDAAQHQHFNPHVNN